jgi:hypothetical protein
MGEDGPVAAEHQHRVVALGLGLPTELDGVVAVGGLGAVEFEGVPECAHQHIAATQRSGGCLWVDHKQPAHDIQVTG